MNYRWRKFVQVVLSQGHITQYSIADLLGQDPIPLQTGGQGGVEVLHHQHRQWGALLKADAEELHDAWVVQSTKKFAFTRKLL